MALENQCVSRIRNWIESEAEFQGRTGNTRTKSGLLSLKLWYKNNGVYNQDEEFLLVFVRGCKLDFEKTKQKLTSYYENRRKYSKWLDNQNFQEPNIRALLQAKAQVSSVEFDDYVTMHSMVVECVLKRPNCQNNGIIWLVDCANYPLWLISRFFNLGQTQNLFQCFQSCFPIQFKAIHLMQISSLVHIFWSWTRPFIQHKIRDRSFMYGSEWPEMFDRVPIDLIPEEYGGQAGKIQTHEDAFIDEISRFQQYVIENKQYGFLND